MTDQFGFVAEQDLGFVPEEDLGFKPETEMESQFNLEQDKVKLGQFNRLAAAQKEQAFQDWYKGISKMNKLDPNPDDPRHFYDYRRYFQDLQDGIAQPPQFRPEHNQYRMPDEYKLPGHPDYYTNTDPQTWTLEQTQRFIKEHPAETPDQEAQYQAFLDTKKAQVERLKASFTDYDRYLQDQNNLQIAERREYPHDALLRDPEKMSTFESFTVPYVKGVAGFFTRPFGVEPFGNTFTPEQAAQAQKDHPLASAFGRAIGGIAPVAAAVALAPETLLGQLFAFATTGAVGQAGAEKTQGSLLDQKGRNERVVKAALKSAAYAPLWYYTKALTLGGPVTSILTRAAVRGTGGAAIEKTGGASSQDAVLSGLMTAALSGVFELTPYAVDKINTTIKSKALDEMAGTLVKNDQDLRNTMIRNYTQKYGSSPSEEELIKLIRAGLTIEVAKSNIPTSSIVTAAEKLKASFEPKAPEVVPPGEKGQVLLPFNEGDIVRAGAVVGKISKIAGDNAIIVSTLGKEFATELKNLQPTGLLPQEIPADHLKKVPEDKKSYVQDLFKVENPNVVDEFIHNDPHYKLDIDRNDQLGEKIYIKSDNPEEWPDYYKPYLDKAIRPDVPAAQGQPEVIIWMGLPGSGKTQMAKALGLNQTHIQVDPDDAKSFIPESMADPALADYVHKESGYMADELLLQRAIEGGKNIIWPMVGKNAQKIADIMQDLRDAGYKIRINYNRLSTIESKKRAYKRYLEDKRLVSTQYIDSVGDNTLDKNYETLKALADQYQAWDVNVKFGQTPKELDKGEGYGKQVEGQGPGRAAAGVRQGGDQEGAAEKNKGEIKFNKSYVYEQMQGKGFEMPVASDFVAPQFPVGTGKEQIAAAWKKYLGEKSPVFDQDGNMVLYRGSDSPTIDDLSYLTADKKEAEKYGTVRLFKIDPAQVHYSSEENAFIFDKQLSSSSAEQVSPQELPSVIESEYDQMSPEDRARYDLEMDALSRTPEGNLFVAIKTLGGIRPFTSSGVAGKKYMAEELKDVPFYLKNKKAAHTLDSIVGELTTFGWHFDDMNELLEEIKFQATHQPQKVDRAALRTIIRNAEKNKELQQKILDKTLPGKRRKFITTVKEAQKTAPEVSAKIESRYEPITNAGTLKQAQDYVQTNYNEAVQLVEGPGRASTFSNAVSIVLIDKAQTEGRFADAIRLVERTAEKNTEMGQTIQALAMYERLTPEGILQYAEKQVRHAREKISQKERLTNYEKIAKTLKTQGEKDKLAEKLGIPHISEVVAEELRRMAEKAQQFTAYEFPDEIPEQSQPYQYMLEMGKKLGILPDQIPPQAQPYQFILEIGKKMQEMGDEIPQEVKQAYQQIFDEFQKSGVTGENVPWTKETQQVFKDAMIKVSRAHKIQTALLLKKISDQIPSNLLQKIAMAQTMAQLLNPKTFIRNILGNIGFQGMENISDTLGALLDISISLRTGKRTVYVPSAVTQLKGAIQGGKEAFQETELGINLKQGQSKFTLPRNGVFNTGVMGSLEKWLRHALSDTDRAFYQSAFNQSIRAQTAAAGLEDPTEEMIEKAHVLGLYRTFQDDNVISDFFVRLKRLLNLQKDFGLGDIVIKYPKTPAAILARGIEYSPFGFVKTVINMARPLAGKEFNQEDFVRSTSRAFTGSFLLVGAGALLAGLGIISGRRAKNQDVAATREMTGIREYQINTSALKRFVMSGLDPDQAQLQEGDQLVSYDWFLPSSIDIALGANLVLNPRESVTDKVLDLGDRLLQASETLQEQPLVRGVKVLTSKQNLAEGVSETLQEIPASFIPTILNQIRQVTDNTARNTKDPNYFQEIYKKAAMRVPGLAGSLPEKIDVLGRTREMYQFGSNNPFNVFLNPAFVTKYQPDPVAKMVLDIWETTGETIHFPRVAQAKVKLGSQTKEPIELTPAQYTEYQKYIGYKTDVLFRLLAANPKFMAKTDDDKAKILQGYLTDINTAAKAEILGYRPKRVSHDVITIIKHIGKNKRAIDKAFKEEDLGFVPEEDLGFVPEQ